MPLHRFRGALRRLQRELSELQSSLDLNGALDVAVISDVSPVTVIQVAREVFFVQLLFIQLSIQICMHLETGSIVP